LCLQSKQREALATRIAGAIKAGTAQDATLSKFFDATQVESDCFINVEKGGVWHLGFGDPVSTATRLQDIDIRAGADFAFMVDGPFLHDLVATIGQSRAGRYSTSGNKDPNGPVEVQAPSLELESPNHDRMVVTVNGTLHQVVDVDFTLTMTDTISAQFKLPSRNVDDTPYLRLVCLAESKLDVHSGAIEAAAIIGLNFLPSLVAPLLPVPFAFPGFFAGFEAYLWIDQQGQAPVPSLPSLGSLLVQMLPVKILLPKGITTQKIVFAYDRKFRVDNKGFLASGTFQYDGRYPTVYLLGPQQLLLPAKGKAPAHVAGHFWIAPDDLRRDDNGRLTVTWESSGLIKYPSGVLSESAEEVDIVFPTKGLQDQTVTVTVVDADGLTVGQDVVLPFDYYQPPLPKWQH
jgi:hypothetical protein